ncbi:MAG: hypothetical protein O3C40_22800 [Planctomycetota bacterium]|nr:hypothetical protein [Planctomycetota bacterium]
MTDKLSESSIVSAVAKEAAERVARRVIAALQRMEETLAGDDSGLKTTWDAICVQVQYEQSFYWDAYDDTVRGIVKGYIADLRRHETEAIWLQTNEGSDWQCDDEEDREAYPVWEGDIINYITSEYVYEEAGRWTNARIRSYFDEED